MPSRSTSRKLQLIVNADDFGLSHDTVPATIECFDAGALTSATIMPGMPATDDAIAFALEHRELGFGAHLTVTGELGLRPLAGKESVPGLVDDEGVFLAPRAARVNALLGRADRRQLELEIEAQVRALQDVGIHVSHVDSHRHLHKFAPFRAALAAVLPRLGVARVRTVQDVYLERAWHSPTYWLRNRWRERIRSSFETTEHFFMAARADPPWAETILQRLPELGNGSLEVGVHPGRQEPWRDRDRLGVLELGRGLGDRVERVDWRTLVPTGGGRS
jgi:predicted glycoside hydrolase/deacetylase ChbG (UPF0249 family)